MLVDVGNEMETSSPVVVIDHSVLQNKAGDNEAASDRESSVESFHTNKSELSIPTESELIDVDEIELSDEESWLYKSPKRQTTEVKNLSTWLHKDVEDMDDLELQVAKTALVSKLNEIKMLNSDLDASLEKLQTKETKPTLVSHNCDTTEKPVIPTKEHNTQDLEVDKSTSSSTNNTSRNSKDDERVKVSKETVTLESIMDVQEIARLQEESLRQSTSKFFNQTERRHFKGGFLSPIENIQGLKLTKPASVDALHMYNGHQSPSNILNSIAPSGMRKQSPFSSALSLNYTPDVHRGSLPNINNGYHSLRQRKSKRPSDPKTQCPLPMYPSKPKSMTYEVTPETSIHRSKASLISPLYDARESRTLPSSYRMNSRSNSANRRESNPLSPSPRRESSPLLPYQRNGSISNTCRRDSAPCNGRKFPSPIGSPTQLKRFGSSTPVLISPSKAMSISNLEARSSSNVDHQRTSHSPARRLPLSTVLNQSPRCGRRSSSPLNGEVKVLKMPSKIPNPASRSGIPVPSTQYISGPSATDESWSQDFY